MQEGHTLPCFHICDHLPQACRGRTSQNYLSLSPAPLTEKYQGLSKRLPTFFFEKPALRVGREGVKKNEKELTVEYVWQPFGAFLINRRNAVVEHWINREQVEIEAQKKFRRNSSWNSDS
jgi:hypothetical protein